MPHAPQTTPSTGLEPEPLSLEIVEARKVYGDFAAVDGLSLQVPAGSIFGLLGPNGAGKTTTIRMIMDIIAPDSGEVLFRGRHRRPGDLHRIGYLPEERGLYRRMTPVDQLVFLGELHGLAASEARRRAMQWLERVDLADRADRKIEELSKGMQQKIQLIGTLLHEPELIILDEPFSGLDPINQSLFKESLADYKASGKTILFSTHILEQAEKLCDHICLIADGRTLLSGSLAELKRSYGGNTYRLETTAAASDVEALPEIARAVSVDGVSVDGGSVDGGSLDAGPLDDVESLRVEVAESATPSRALRALVERFEVREFRSEEPDLEEIFIRAVREAGANVERHELRA